MKLPKSNARRHSVVPSAASARPYRVPSTSPAVVKRDAGLAPRRGAGGGARLVEPARRVLDEGDARPRRRRPRIAASSQTSVATPKSDDLVRVERVEQRVRVRVREHVEVLLQEQDLAPPVDAPRDEARRDRHLASGSGSSCSVSGIFCAPRVPRRQCGGYVSRKSGSSRDLRVGQLVVVGRGDVDEPALARAATSRSIAGRDLLGAGDVELPVREHEVDLRVDVPEDRPGHRSEV